MVLYETAGSFSEVMSHMAEIQKQFRQEYREMVEAVLSLRKATFLCTIYDAIPNLEGSLAAALSLFNDSILRQAIRAGLAVIDLRQRCTEASDYAGIWPIEPSVAGGAKIARGIVSAVTTPLPEWSGCQVLGV